MKYRVALAATAKADIRESARWMIDQASQAVADKWLAGLDKAMATLETRPRRCPVAAEGDKFPEEIRQLLYGRRKSGKHRILFKIDGDTVFILIRPPHRPRRTGALRSPEHAVGNARHGSGHGTLGRETRSRRSRRKICV